ncbi:MAG: hypothetical protein HKM06_00355 [Spirochaetales bacterium]|nr:hypothetical protein [Spirochaetales bacterium]
MPNKRQFGIQHRHQDNTTREHLISAINMKLAALGLPVYEARGTDNLDVARDLIRNIREKNRLLEDYLPPADRRIQAFLDAYLADTGEKAAKLPSNSFIADRYGMARELSLPPDASLYRSSILTSYRVRQGILHNPLNDRRTTKGVFHIAEGGLPVPPDKKAVPKVVFARLLEAALNPPKELAEFPYTAGQTQKASGFISGLLRPVVCPEVPGYLPEKSMEIRFFAPGNLVSNLDFVESIFGNAGDPFLPENDAALDPLHWSGHTGCIILATHLTGLKKKDLGLPAWDKATERQRRDGMAWKSVDELYNDGGAFKICARDERGVIVTLIADNYYGYSKKEIKTQISYAANLMGLVEEEHAGGALAFPRYNLGMRFVPDSPHTATLLEALKLLGDQVDVRPEGYAVDKTWPQLIYIPEDATIDLEEQKVFWHRDGRTHALKVLPNQTYILPSGYKVHMEKHPATTAWRLVGTAPEGTLCHKPCTVSGGGKSEISKSIYDAIHFNPIIIGDYDKDMDLVEKIIDTDYSKIWLTPQESAEKDLLSEKLSLLDVIQLLSPSALYTSAHNSWVDSIPSRIKALVYLVKRFHGQNSESRTNWKEHFSVDVVNGTAGNIFQINGRPVMGAYLRVGVRENGAGWTYKLRQDFMPAAKIQWEDDITASVIVPSKNLPHLNPEYTNPSVKFSQNCEVRFFQRPDDAVHRGYDKQAEKDLSSEGNFISNFEPFERVQAKEFLENVIDFTEYTRPVQQLVEDVAARQDYDYFVLSSHPRMVDGAPSKNPRYLQTDPNYLNPQAKYLADVGTRLARRVPAGKSILNPINAVLPGRRNNPAEAGIRPLAVYNPIHFQELPELFMDFICSLTGKSPSTTGAGSEGALTKGPFNALVATADLNNALLGFILTGYNGFSSAAGYIGTRYRVEHDISLLVPELWCRLEEHERDPQRMIAQGQLEKVEDFEYQGRKVLASRLGYRITYAFATNFLGRIFDDPGIVFNEELLRPEKQSLPDFVDGVENIVDAQRKVALDYFEDHSVESAIPPLQALLHIMAYGSWNGKDAQHPEVRALFDRENVLKSAWYKERLETYRQRQLSLQESHKVYLKHFLSSARHHEEAKRLEIHNRLNEVEVQIEKLQRADYLESLVGTIGADPLYRGPSGQN